MRKHLRVVASLAALSGAGCVEDLSLQITALVPVSREMACIVPATAMAGMIQTAATVDVGVVEAGYPGLTVFPVVRNNLAPAGSTVVPTDEVTVSGFDVEIAVPTSLQAALPQGQRSFFTPSFGGAVKPTEFTVPKVIAIPRQVIIQLAQAITGTEIEPPRANVKVRAVGSHTGSTVTSNWISFPVSLCRWCLTGGPPAACPAPPPKKEDVRLGSCFVSQDERVSCCVGARNAVLCGPDHPIAAM